MLSITIGVTAHAEGILLHKTLLSVHRAIARLDSSIAASIIVHLDNPTDETTSYVTTHRSDDIFRNVAVYTNHFGDLGTSRNFVINKAESRYIAFIDADDLMSEMWLASAYRTLEQRPYGSYVAHSTSTVEFDGANSLIIKHGEIDKDTDSLLLAFANRWNSVIFAPTELLKNNPYEANSKGYGYEDWQLNARLVQQGIHNILVPETAIFVRRKQTNSEWARQIQSKAVLRRNPALAFSSVRKNKAVLPTASAVSELAANIPKNLRQNKLLRRVGRSVKRRVANRQVSQTVMPKWLQDEMRAISSLDKQLFPSREKLATMDTYDSLTIDHYRAGELYRALASQTTYDTYDYVLIIPWLIKGGADMFSINYANYIKRLFPQLNILVVATLPVKPLWREKLDHDIDYVAFGEVTQHAPDHIRERVFEQFIENSGCRYLHVINSEFGYDFIASHKDYIKGSGKKVVATAFSESVDAEGKVFGYSHTHVPKVYDICTLITSDNQALLTMWQEEYGFDPGKLQLHRQPIEPSEHQPKPRHARTPGAPLSILWAARLSPEKLPELAVEIARALDPKSVRLTMYGSMSSDYRKMMRDLPAHVTYGGEFDGFNTLRPEAYDVYLYTSSFDGMPSSVIEAGMYSLPVIASAVGGIPEVIDESNGALVRPFDDQKGFIEAITALAQNPDEAKKRGEALRETIEQQFNPLLFEERVKHMIKVLGYKT